MKKLNVLLTASLLGLAIAGTALLADTASAKDPTPQNAEQTEAKKPAQRELKDWEKKYYELHPDQLKQDQEKAHPEKRRHTDEDDVEWHRL